MKKLLFILVQKLNKIKWWEKNRSSLSSFDSVYNESELNKFFIQFRRNLSCIFIKTLDAHSQNIEKIRNNVLSVIFVL